MIWGVSQFALWPGSLNFWVCGAETVAAGVTGCC